MIGRGIRGVLRDQRGYTLVELVVSSTIFILLAVVVVGVLVSVTQTSSKTAAQRKVQQDARVNIEEVARAVRTSRIDYSFYRENAGDARCRLPGDATGSRALPLLQTVAGPANTPDDSTRVVFFYDPGTAANGSEGALYRYENSADATAPTCNELFASADKVRLTADNVAVTATRFFVSPLTDPDGADCPGAVPNASCQLPKNTHPRVTVSATVRTKQAVALTPNEQAETSETVLQTTVGSRSYPIENLSGQSEGSAPGPAPVILIKDGNDYALCEDSSRSDYCRSDPAKPTAVYSLSGGTGGNPVFRTAYIFSVPSAGTYDLKLSYYNFPLGGLNPPSGYSYEITAWVLLPSGWRQEVVNLPIEAAPTSSNPRGGTLIPGLSLPADDAVVVIDWANDSYQANVYDANFGIVNVSLEQ